LGKLLVDPEYQESIIHPANVIMITSIIAGITFTPIARKSPSPSTWNKKTFFLVAMMGVADALANMLLFFGLLDVESKTASILLDTEILFTVLIAVTIFRERLTLKESLTCIMIFTGSVFLPLTIGLYETGFVFSDSFGAEIIILVATAIFASDTGMARYVSEKISAERISQISAFFGGLFALCVDVTFQIPFDVNIQHLPYLLIIGILITGFSYYLMIVGLKLIGIIKTILIYSTISTFGVVFAYVFLEESITYYNILSICLIFTGIILLRKKIAKLEKD
jgi:drug/metabolite transporter (DMT)-like permease